MLPVNDDLYLLTTVSDLSTVKLWSIFQWELSWIMFRSTDLDSASATMDTNKTAHILQGCFLVHVQTLTRKLLPLRVQFLKQSDMSWSNYEVSSTTTTLVILYQQNFLTSKWDWSMWYLWFPKDQLRSSPEKPVF